MQRKPSFVAKETRIHPAERSRDAHSRKTWKLMSRLLAGWWRTRKWWCIFSTDNSLARNLIKRKPNERVTLHRLLYCYQVWYQRRRRQQRTMNLRFFFSSTWSESAKWKRRNNGQWEGNKKKKVQQWKWFFSTCFEKMSLEPCDDEEKTLGWKIYVTRFFRFPTAYQMVQTEREGSLPFFLKKKKWSRRRS